MRIEIVSDIKRKRKDDNRYVKEVLKGGIIDRSRAEKTLVVTPKIFSKLFSTERIKLMLRIKKNKLKNIYQLAKELDRPYESVYRDIKLLEGYDLIKIRTKNKKKIPYVDDTIREIALS